MDPLVTKIVSTPATSAAQPDSVAPKDRASKFDKVRAKVGAGSTGSQAVSGDPVHGSNEPLRLSPSRAGDDQATRNSSASKQQLNNDLASRRDSLRQLKDRLAAVPQTSSLDSLRSRLRNLESQYQKVGSAVQDISGSSSPERLLQLQRDMYRLDENLGIASKLVDQVTTSVKSILQTQI
jgi:hypothetical protein